MKFYVYLLLSKKGKSYFSYVGYTNNLQKRIHLHNTSKGAKYTKGKKWKLIYFESYDNKSKALKEEYKLKKNYLLRNKIKKKFINNVKI